MNLRPKMANGLQSYWLRTGIVETRNVGIFKLRRELETPSVLLVWLVEVAELQRVPRRGLYSLITWIYV